jgi:hypothetical protein
MLSTTTKFFIIEIIKSFKIGAEASFLRTGSLSSGEKKAVFFCFGRLRKPGGGSVVTESVSTERKALQHHFDLFLFADADSVLRNVVGLLTRSMPGYCLHRLRFISGWFFYHKWLIFFHNWQEKFYKWQQALLVFRKKEIIFMKKKDYS